MSIQGVRSFLVELGIPLTTGVSAGLTTLPAAISIAEMVAEKIGALPGAVVLWVLEGLAVVIGTGIGEEVASAAAEVSILAALAIAALVESIRKSFVALASREREEGVAESVELIPATLAESVLIFVLLKSTRESHHLGMTEWYMMVGRMVC